jgi:WD40 repeat protein
MVTCLDVVGQTVISGSLDNTLALWDLRSTDQSLTFKPLTVAGATSVRGRLVSCWWLACGDRALSAACDARGCFLLSLAQPPSPLLPATAAGRLAGWQA